VNPCARPPAPRPRGGPIEMPARTPGARPTIAGPEVGGTHIRRRLPRGPLCSRLQRTTLRRTVQGVLALRCRGAGLSACSPSAIAKVSVARTAMPAVPPSMGPAHRGHHRRVHRSQRAPRDHASLSRQRPTVTPAAPVS
jgi:hypothetical protein